MQSDREIVAQIIDPYAAWGNVRDETDIHRQVVAMSKADAVIAALSAPTADDLAWANEQVRSINAGEHVFSPEIAKRMRDKITSLPTPSAPSSEAIEHLRAAAKAALESGERPNVDYGTLIAVLAERDALIARVEAAEAEVARVSEAAAIAVLFPLWKERAAMVADDHAERAWEIANKEGQNSMVGSGRNHAARDIAAAIRAMEVGE
jgi:hypothetical protein